MKKQLAIFTIALLAFYTQSSFSFEVGSNNLNSYSLKSNTNTNKSSIKTKEKSNSTILGLKAINKKTQLKESNNSKINKINFAPHEQDGFNENLDVSVLELINHDKHRLKAKFTPKHTPHPEARIKGPPLSRNTTKNFLTNQSPDSQTSRNSAVKYANYQSLRTDPKADLDRQSLVDMTVDNQKIIAKTESTEPLLSDWLRVYSPAYKNAKLFPDVSLPNYSSKKITLDEETDFRINDKFFDDTDYFKRYQFYFRLSNKNLYYSNDIDSLNILDSLPIKRIEKVENFPLTTPEDALCFGLTDKEKISNWKLCAQDIKTMKTWACMVKNLIGQIDQACKERIEEELPPTIITQQITQPILLIPQPAKHCNDNWNYFKKGSDWECECVEGKEQSPIDLPNAGDAIPSPVKPIFQYEEVNPQEIVVDEKGDKKVVNIKFEFMENMIQINPQTSSFGKVITLDGRIYKASKVVFHTPSEHTIEGKQFDLEMQIIHTGVTKGDLSKQVIVSVLFTKKAGVYNRFIDALDFFNLPSVIYPSGQINKMLYVPSVLFHSDSDDVSSMKPVSFYTYQGSLSFPPCNERTIVYVLSKPLELSTTAVQMFIEAIRIPDYQDSLGNVLINKEKAENNRKIQPLNGRKVFYYDHIKYCGPDPEKRSAVNKVEGHFEKVSSKITQFVYVNSEKPSGMPNSFVVSENEAKGINVGVDSK